MKNVDKNPNTLHEPSLMNEQKIFNYVKWIGITIAVVFVFSFSLRPLLSNFQDTELCKSLKCIVQLLPQPVDAAFWGQIGDYFGGILNPIVGIATIYLILISIRMQRQELTETRAELKQSSAALNKQVEIATLQGFEQSFFSWLSNFRSLVNSISTDPSQEEVDKYQGIPIGNPLSGLNALAYLWGYNKSKKSFPNVEISIKKVESYRHMDNSTQSESGIDFPYELRIVRDSVELDWDIFYQTNGYQVDGLFRTLIGLIEWINKHEQLSKSQKWHYVDIVVAQLSRLELNLLFFYGISRNGKTVRPLIEKFALLHHLNSDDIVIEQLKKFGLRDDEIYSHSAFNREEAKILYPETT
jgi:hypothetical protein